MAMLLLLLGLSLSFQGVPDIEWATLPEALSEAQTAQQPTLVYVRAAWCGPCRQLERETFT
ncbi:MAG: thioredoxin family protein, partial [Pseudomonadota bacterium]